MYVQLILVYVLSGNLHMLNKWVFYKKLKVMLLSAGWEGLSSVPTLSTGKVGFRV